MESIDLNPDTCVTMIFEGATLTSVALWLQSSTFKLPLQKEIFASALVLGWAIATTI